MREREREREHDIKIYCVKKKANPVVHFLTNKRSDENNIQTNQNKELITHREIMNDKIL